jgi:hypothetical protein
MTESQVISIPEPKDPRTEEDFNWNCGPMMKPGDGVASVTKVFVERGDSALSIGVPAISEDGQQVSARIGGGRRGQRYRVTILFTTDTGEKLALSLEFDCL